MADELREIEALMAISSSHKSSEEQQLDTSEDQSSTESSPGSSPEYQLESADSESLRSDEEDSEPESEDDQDTEQVTWISENKNILWHPTHEVAKHYIAPTIPEPGPTLYAQARVRCIETAFELFFTKDMLEKIVRMTNLQGQKTASDWRILTVQELQCYIGLLLLAGLFRSRHEATSSLWNSKTGRPMFVAAMSHHRFRDINRILRFDDKLNRPQRHHHTKLSPISDIWNSWNFRLQKNFYPGREICVGEQLIEFRGHCSFRQYMPSKPARYGIKVWALCDVKTTYAWKMEVYSGKPPGDRRDANVGMRVVLGLTDSLHGHEVTTDNFFTSIPLAKEL